MADDKLDISSLFGDTFKQISDALSGETQKKKTTKKKTTAKKTTSKTGSAVNKATSAGIAAAKKAATTKSSGSRSTAKKTTASKKTSSSKKAGTIMLEINGRQIDFKTIEQKAARLGGNCYVVVNEKKIYNEDGKSVNLY